MLYTSENSSLAYLETLVHFDEAERPPSLYIMKIEVDNNAPLYTLPDEKYPAGWMQPGLLENKVLGDHLMTERKFLGIKVKSVINSLEYNYLLNPLFPGFNDLVKVVDVIEVKPDDRLVD